MKHLSLECSASATSAASTKLHHDQWKDHRLEKRDCACARRSFGWQLLLLIQGTADGGVEEITVSTSSALGGEGQENSSHFIDILLLHLSVSLVI